MSRFVLALVGVVLWGAARVIAAPAENTDVATPPLTATFETVSRVRGAAGRGPVRERWTLAREPRRIAYSFGQADNRRLDVWSLSAAELRLLRVFPGERTSVEYTQGQLRALGSVRSWQQLGSLLPKHPAALGLKPVGSGKFQDRKILRFEGELDGARVSVQWLEQEQLPALLSMVGVHNERTTTLQKLSVGATDSAAGAEAKRYRRIDAADLGDLEHDPFVKRHGALLQSGHHHF
jgi:hypothetical protein